MFSVAFKYLVYHSISFDYFSLQTRDLALSKIDLCELTSYYNHHEQNCSYKSNAPKFKKKKAS